MSSVLGSREGNHLLAALCAPDRQRLQAHLERVELTAGAHLYDAGAPLRYVYFPTTAVISLIASMRDGATIEVAVVGNEGVAGVCAFMGSRAALCGAVTVVAGDAWRIGARAVADLARAPDTQLQPVMQYLQALFTQIAQTSACNRHHAIEQQLCRWLLLNADRRDEADLHATQERIARMLGVRREGVTAGALKLQRAGLIRYGRGRITILDRPGLEHRSCECYAVVRDAYRDLMGAPAALPRAAYTKGASYRDAVATPAVRSRCDQAA